VREKMNQFVDFLCYEKKIIVELDGGQHVERAAYDDRRTRFLENQGYRVIRFWDNDVMNYPAASSGVSQETLIMNSASGGEPSARLKNMDGVLLELARLCNLEDPHPIPLPSSFRTGEGVYLSQNKIDKNPSPTASADGRGSDRGRMICFTLNPWGVKNALTFQGYLLNYCVIIPE
jgi:hypothetical protein